MELLTENDQKEALSIAYIRAIAARAGLATSQPDFDRDSVDVMISAGGSMRPQLHIQAKATENLNLVGDSYKFELSLKNYNDLRARTQVPRILVVLRMPKSKSEWIDTSENNLILRHSAYWASLYGAPETSNKKCITVDVPKDNSFDVSGLTSLMGQASSGDI